MKTILFDITEKDTNEALSKRLVKLSAYIFWELPVGKWQLSISKPIRTQPQNRMIHALFTDLSTELNGLGITINFGNYEASWTPETAKEFFKQIYLAGKKTSECNTRELSDAANKLIHDINSKGGQLAVKDEFLNQLLNEAH